MAPRERSSVNPVGIISIGVAAIIGGIIVALTMDPNSVGRKGTPMWVVALVMIGVGLAFVIAGVRSRRR